jgi:hypothetical protein
LVIFDVLLGQLLERPTSKFVKERGETWRRAWRDFVQRAWSDKLSRVEGLLPKNGSRHVQIPAMSV